jgi:hypothetical protein
MRMQARREQERDRVVRMVPRGEVLRSLHLLKSLQDDFEEVSSLVEKLQQLPDSRVIEMGVHVR